MTLARFFCLLTFGHSWQTYYGYGCRLQDDFLVCRKCGQRQDTTLGGDKL